MNVLDCFKCCLPASTASSFAAWCGEIQAAAALKSQEYAFKESGRVVDMFDDLYKKDSVELTGNLLESFVSRKTYRLKSISAFRVSFDCNDIEARNFVSKSHNELTASGAEIEHAIAWFEKIASYEKRGHFAVSILGSANYRGGIGDRLNAMVG